MRIWIFGDDDVGCGCCCCSGVYVGSGGEGDYDGAVFKHGVGIGLPL